MVEILNYLPQPTQDHEQPQVEAKRLVSWKYFSLLPPPSFPLFLSPSFSFSLPPFLPSSAWWTSNVFWARNTKCWSKAEEKHSLPCQQMHHSLTIESRLKKTWPFNSRDRGLLKLWGRLFRQEHVFSRITGSTAVARTLSGCHGRKTCTGQCLWTGGQGSRGLPTWNIGIVSESVIHRHCIRLISFIPTGQWGLATSGDRQWFVKKFFCKDLVRTKETTYMKMC